MKRAEQVAAIKKERSTPAHQYKMSSSGRRLAANQADNPDRKVHREVFDNSVVDVGGVATRRQYVSRYNEGGDYLSQGYTHHGPASENERRSGTWKG